MSYNLRGRKVAYDNISVGNATGRERLCPNLAAPSTDFGATPSTEGGNGGTGGSTDPAGSTSSTTAKDYTNINRTTDGFNTSDPLNNIQIGVVTLRGERLGA